MTTFDHVLSIGTGLVTIFSALASLLNHVVRTHQAQGKPVSQSLLGAGAVVNVASLNIDKAVQLVKLVRDLRAEAKAPPDGSAK